MSKLSADTIASSLLDAYGTLDVEELKRLVAALAEQDQLQFLVAKALLQRAESASLPVRCRAITLIMILGLWKIQSVLDGLFDVFENEFPESELRRLAAADRAGAIWHGRYSGKESVLRTLLYALMSTKADRALLIASKVHSAFADLPFGEKIRKWMARFYPERAERFEL
jgi:hypothetical protein